MGSRVRLGFFIVFACFLNPISSWSDSSSVSAACNPCTRPDPIEYIPPECTPTPIPTATATCTATPTRTATPTCTATPTATPIVCVDHPYVYNDGNCNYNCNRRYCNGVLTVNNCGSAYSCNYCSGVAAYQQCACSGGITSGYYNFPGRVNYFIYGRDGQQVCYSESCLRCNKSFDPEAQVLLSDGHLKVVKDLTVKDQLMSPKGKALKIKQILESREEQPLYELKAGEKSLKVTNKHVVWTSKGLKQARNLKVGDVVKLSDGKEVSLQAVIKLPVKLNQKAYGIALDAKSDKDEDHLMIGGGFVVGDYSLETKLDK